MFVDTHCHLSFSDFDADRDAIVGRMVREEIEILVNPGVDVNESQNAVMCAQRYSSVYAAVGCHPCHVLSIDFLPSVMTALEHLVDEEKVVAIGETGFDFYKEVNPPKHVQDAYFLEHIRLAKQFSKPLIVHSRMAWDDTFRVLEAEQDGTLSGVFHCFSGNEKEVKRAVDLGFMISFSGTVTFKNKTNTQIVPSVPIDYLLTETDAPFLSPHPFRGKRNDPLKIPLIVGEIARLREAPIEDIKTSVSRNAKKLFKLN
ncbi:hypothetical protein CHS0354_023828 [Potamilus streckersoni]|uniref:Uncharacterized protein n=1 Tax=Potamilus streckersoni TaxID=2493646 RepID=A0AAE0RZF5_9BIVA|nr:hypothetical protein CHS0354_023828 [Potamilus streckersoni]